MKFFIILLATILAESCGNTKEINATTLTDTMDQTEQLSGDYTITVVKDSKNISEPLTISFDDKTNKVSGYSGCNRFFGTFKITDNTISLSELASTKKMCRGESNTLEQNMLKALNSTTHFTLEAGELLLKQGDNVMVSANKIMETTTNNKMAQDYSTIEYTAVSRGFYYACKIENNTFSVKKNRNEEATIKTLNDNTQTEINNLVNAVDLASISELEAPTKAHQYDGAAIASLTITKDGKTYTSTSFDAGNPPEEIAELVNTLLKTAEKQ
ncbi:META domain-containing protein [Lacinutrix chionoecetis]